MSIQWKLALSFVDVPVTHPKRTPDDVPQTFVPRTLSLQTFVMYLVLADVHATCGTIGIARDAPVVGSVVFEDVC